MSRYLAWFSCGAASAVAAKMAVDKYGDQCEVLYCDTLKYEHADNRRFMDDVSRWLGREIKILKSEKYSDIYDVFDKTGWLVGPGGARCTTELKKMVRVAYQKPDDTHVFGFTSDETNRVKRFHAENPDLKAIFPLLKSNWDCYIDQSIPENLGITKSGCFKILDEAGIDRPAMYKLGYKNNNCIGCVKGQQGYWNKIRVDFPEVFAKMAAQERKMNAAINKKYVKGERVRVFLDELDPKAGKWTKEPDIECGVLCIHET